MAPRDEVADSSRDGSTYIPTADLRTEHPATSGPQTLDDLRAYDSDLDDANHGSSRDDYC